MTKSQMIFAIGVLLLESGEDEAEVLNFASVLFDAVLCQGMRAVGTQPHPMTPIWCTRATKTGYCPYCGMPGPLCRCFDDDEDD